MSPPANMGRTGRSAPAAPGAPLPSRRVVLAALVLLVAHVVLIVCSSRAMGVTSDETNYLNCGNIILRHGWVHETTLFQGPVPLVANQLFVGSFPSDGYRGGPEQADLLRRGRLGTLPFALLAAVLVFVWARSAFGDAGGLLALLFHVANPATTLLATVPYALFALGYLSFTRMQMGVRYVLPLYPLLFVTLGSLARPAPGALPRPPRKPFFLALAALAALHARELVASWPDWISYFNSLSGGQAGAYRHFRDSNSDFGQYDKLPSLELLAARSGPLHVLGRHSGPRFGRLAVDDGTLRMVDDSDPTRPRFDWLTLEPPLAHLGASWYVFECSPEKLEERLRAREDAQFREALVCANLGADRIDDAERHLQHLDAAAAAPYRRVLALLARARELPDVPTLEALARAWQRIGRPDCVVDLARAHPELAGSADVVMGQALALEERGDHLAALEWLAERQDELDAQAGVLLMRYLLRARQADRALEYFETLQRLFEGEGQRDSELLREIGRDIEQLRSELELLR